MIKWIIFSGLSIPVIIISWKTILNFRSHGFYRFFSWECILWLFANNYGSWFREPFSPMQIVSWILLIISGYLVIAGVTKMKKFGRPEGSRDGEALYQFEKTTRLVDTGIFRYIRHPLYASLVYLTWGTALKDLTWIIAGFAVLSTLFLILTAVFDERESIRYFGESYREYMRRSKRFIPYIF